MNSETPYSKLVSALRLEKGLSVRALAKETGISASALSWIMIGHVLPTKKQLEAIWIAVGGDFADHQFLWFVAMDEYEQKTLRRKDD